VENGSVCIFFHFAIEEQAFGVGEKF